MIMHGDLEPLVDKATAARCGVPETCLMTIPQLESVTRFEAQFERGPCVRCNHDRAKCGGQPKDETI